MNHDWMRVRNEAEISSPALLLYPDRVEENLRRMIKLAGGPARLRPHIKTHKLPHLVAMQVRMGINKCKCATIAEAEMAAEAGATDILLAAQLVGPNVERWRALTQAYPHCRFISLVDALAPAALLSETAATGNSPFSVLLDLDVGQHRTGIAPRDAVELCRTLATLPGIKVEGVHAYDGHLHQTDVNERANAANAVWSTVEELRRELLAESLAGSMIVMGGTPTFPMHARREGVECSPGTCVLWDAGYSAKLPHMDFLVSAVLLTRVVSRPAAGRLCLDLGHKAVASEMAHPRVIFPELPEARAVAHNEEHLVLETPRADEFNIGAVLHGIPWHICPTVALHSTAHIVVNGAVTEEWPVVGRQRKLHY